MVKDSRSKDEAYVINQGYMGKSTHKGINALDFSMPLGTEILAVRSGVVVKVIQSNDKSCIQKECVKFNNLIIIYHKDGTFAEYVILKKRIKGESWQSGYTGSINWIEW